MLRKTQNIAVNRRISGVIRTRFGALDFSGFPVFARFLPAFCSAFTRFLPGFCSFFTSFLPAFYPIFTRLLPAFCLVFTRFLLENYPFFSLDFPVFVCYDYTGHFIGRTLRLFAAPGGFFSSLESKRAAQLRRKPLKTHGI